MAVGKLGSDLVFRTAKPSCRGGKGRKRSRLHLIIVRGDSSPRPTSGTIEDGPQIQTPSRAEHGPEGVLILRTLRVVLRASAGGEGDETGAVEVSHGYCGGRRKK